MIALLLACSDPTVPPSDPTGRVEWLLDRGNRDHLDPYRRELLDILRYDPVRAHRHAAHRALARRRALPEALTDQADPEVLSATYDSWSRFVEDPVWAQECWRSMSSACTLVWGCEGDPRTCQEGAPAVCHTWDRARRGCFVGQGPCVQEGNSVPDAGAGSPTWWNDAPRGTELGPLDPAVRAAIDQEIPRNPRPPKPPAPWWPARPQ